MVDIFLFSVEQTASIIRMVYLLFIRFRWEIPPQKIVKFVAVYMASHPNKKAIFVLTVVRSQNVL